MCSSLRVPGGETDRAETAAAAGAAAAALGPQGTHPGETLLYAAPPVLRTGGTRQGLRAACRVPSGRLDTRPRSA